MGERGFGDESPQLALSHDVAPEERRGDRLDRWPPRREAVADACFEPPRVGDALHAVVEGTIRTHAGDLASGFVAESAEKLRRLPQYYLALLGRAAFPPVQCNAPWTSVVVEADGSVRPCFFHQRIGNVREAPLSLIVRDGLSAFRRTLDVATNPVCTRCVCALKTSWRGAPWQ